MAKPGGAHLLSPTAKENSSSPSTLNRSSSFNKSNSELPTTPVDSKIPRPSSTSLRRSSSLRLRGERALTPRYNQLQQNSFLNQKAGCHDAQQFPVIIENGLDSPSRERSSVSNLINIICSFKTFGSLFFTGNIFFLCLIKKFTI